ncbi:hypothetical protein K493DRAFT_318867 [Basidiobolus meristosporus CBS 931.73]|uniref:Uncharacterized protein n=1 Tax=Basidiobolus meristosporus CBS 931.73 TaxID=1314790 RepID=A0A1Y1XVB9_9FUNG|nr:hypothetical protein K493DRAFT_318867 [Basidiobolus meristosporus CBS 931.73]|eukprot:ORX89224.1 hypothetical protein K493DRAFT_318867 [Basidiobolus meristosporus CBS 931.73]
MARVSTETDSSSDSENGLSLEHTKDFALNLFRRKKDRRESSPTTSSIGYNHCETEKHLSEIRADHQRTLADAGAPLSPPPRKESISSSSVPIHRIPSSLVHPHQRNDTQIPSNTSEHPQYYPSQAHAEHTNSSTNSHSTGHVYPTSRSCTYNVNRHSSPMPEVESANHRSTKNVRFSITRGSSPTLQRMSNVVGVHRRSSIRGRYSYSGSTDKSTNHLQEEAQTSIEYDTTENSSSLAEYRLTTDAIDHSIYQTDALTAEARFQKQFQVEVFQLPPSSRDSILRESKSQESPLYTSSDSKSTENSEQEDDNIASSVEASQNNTGKMKNERAELLQEIELLRRQLKAETEAKQQVTITLENARRQFDRISTASFLKLKEVSKENKRLANELKALNGRVTTSGYSSRRAK